MKYLKYFNLSFFLICKLFNFLKKLSNFNVFVFKTIFILSIIIGFNNNNCMNNNFINNSENNRITNNNIITNNVVSNIVNNVANNGINNVANNVIDNGNDIKKLLNYAAKSINLIFIKPINDLFKFGNNEIANFGIKEIKKEFIIDCKKNKIKEIRKKIAFFGELGEKNKKDIINNTIDKRGLNPLCIACEKGYEEIVEYLIKNGADVNWSVDKDKSDYFKSFSPIHFACFGSKNDENSNDENNTVKSNTSKGIIDSSTIGKYKNDKSNVCKNKKNRLMNKLKIVSLLINAGADVNKKANFGFTPLSIACGTKNIELIELLTSKNLKSKNNKIDNNKINIDNVFNDAVFTGRLEEAKLLLSFGANIEDKVRKNEFILKEFKELFLIIEKFDNAFGSVKLNDFRYENFKEILVRRAKKKEYAMKLDINNKSGISKLCDVKVNVLK